MKNDITVNTDDAILVANHQLRYSNDHRKHLFVTTSLRKTGNAQSYRLMCEFTSCALLLFFNSFSFFNVAFFCLIGLGRL